MALCLVRISLQTPYHIVIDKPGKVGKRYTIARLTAQINLVINVILDFFAFDAQTRFWWQSFNRAKIK